MIGGGMARGLPTPSDWQEARRWQALALKQQGWKQQRIAQALGVTKGTVSQWMARVREYGVFCLSLRKGPFQTLVTQKPRLLHLEFLAIKTPKKGSKCGAKL